MGARFYDPALGRWLSADTIVPELGNVQSLNRFSYVVGNPLRHTDPTGHCHGVPGDGKDDACWGAYFETIRVLGSGFDFLGQWGLSDLTSLLQWVTQGVRFASDAGVAWTSGNVRDVLKALNRTQAVLGDIAASALGLEGAGMLTFLKHAAGRADVRSQGGRGGGNLIQLWLLKTSNEYAVETTIHEIGHIVDGNAGSGGLWWSTSSTMWREVTGWKQHYEYGHWYVADAGAWNAGVRDYSRSSVLEDFADTFAWYIESTAPGAGGYDKARPSTSNRSLAPRLNALSVALGQFP